MGDPDAGHGTVLIPAAGTTSATWIGVVERHLADGRRVLALDIPGDAGQSESGPRRLRTPGDTATWVTEVLDCRGLTTVHLLGHSYGAWIAARTALTFPERITRVTLLDPTAVVALPHLRLIVRALPTHLGLIRPSVAASERLLLGELGARASRVPRWWIELVCLAMAAGPWRYPSTPVPDGRELARSIVDTTVVLAADSGVHDPVRIAGLFGDRMPRAKVITAPRATHYSLPWEDDPQLVEALR